MYAGAGEVNRHYQIHHDDYQLHIHAAHAQNIIQTGVELNDGQTHVRADDDQRHDHEGIHNGADGAVAVLADERIQGGTGAEGASAVIGGDRQRKARHGHDKVGGDAVMQEAVLKRGNDGLGRAALHTQKLRGIQKVLHGAGHAKEANADGDTAGQRNGDPREGFDAGLCVFAAQTNITHLAEHNPKTKDTGDNGAKHIDPLEVFHGPCVEGVHAVIECRGKCNADDYE